LQYTPLAPAELFIPQSAFRIPHSVRFAPRRYVKEPRSPPRPKPSSLKDGLRQKLNAQYPQCEICQFILFTLYMESEIPSQTQPEPKPSAIRVQRFHGPNPLVAFSAVNPEKPVAFPVAGFRNL